MNKYLYLVSDGEKVFATTEAPEGLTVSDGNWQFKCVSSSVGYAISDSTDDIWKGPIGVYASSDINQILRMTEDLRIHSLHLAYRRIDRHIFPLIAKGVLDEIYVHLYASPRNPAPSLSPSGQIGWNIRELLLNILVRRK